MSSIAGELKYDLDCRIYQLRWFAWGITKILLRSTKNAFIVQSKSTFLDGVSSTPICPPPPKNSSGAVASLSRIYPRTKRKLFHLADWEKIERSVATLSSGENQSIDEKENAVLMQTELKFYGRTGLWPTWVRFGQSLALLNRANINSACFVGMRDDAFLFNTGLGQ